MPGIDGFEVCRLLKASDEARGIPLIFISASTEVEERVDGLRLGAVDYITKPFHREELLARVRTHFELGRLRCRLEQEVAERTRELRATIESLRESEERFRNMADTAPVMIWVSGKDELRTFFNQAWLDFTGRSFQQERGKGWAEGVHCDDLERCFYTHRSSIETRSRFEMKYRLRRADGEYRSVLEKGVPRFAPHGDFAGYIGSAIDITDQDRILEAALAGQKLEALAVLTRGIAHDFSNLIAGILAQSELADTALADGISPVAEIRQIRAVGVRACEIVRELMIYSGQKNDNLEKADLSELVKEMVGLLTASISKQVILDLDLCRQLPPVQCSATQIRQVLMNLIINASQAIGDKPGRIHVRTSRAIPEREPAPTRADSCQVRLEVSDTGRGMTKEEKARIFDPFFTTKSGGHGLGLATVYGIVQSHGGAINVVSTPGMGATFSIFLPATDWDTDIAVPAVCAATQCS
jgi:PAS domain S-box-containing protein